MFSTLDDDCVIEILVYLDTHERGMLGFVSKRMRLRLKEMGIDVSGVTIMSLSRSREYLLWGMGFGMPWTESTGFDIAKSGNIDTLDLAIRLKCPTVSMGYGASYSGNIGVLEWLKERNLLRSVAEDDGKMFHVATVTDNNQHVMQWLHNNKYTFTDGSCKVASRFSPNNLAWLIAHNAPINIKDCITKAVKGMCTQSLALICDKNNAEHNTWVATSVLTQHPNLTMHETIVKFGLYTNATSLVECAASIGFNHACVIVVQYLLYPQFRDIGTETMQRKLDAFYKDTNLQLVYEHIVAGAITTDNVEVLLQLIPPEFIDNRNTTACAASHSAIGVLHWMRIREYPYQWHPDTYKLADHDLLGYLVRVGCPVPVIPPVTTDGGCVIC
jgi:hypothetical protein